MKEANKAPKAEKLMDKWKWLGKAEDKNQAWRGQRGGSQSIHRTIESL